MFLYNFPLDVTQVIFLFRILERCHRMMKTMQAFSLRQICLIVPVVKEIIVQQRPPNKVMLIAANSQLFVQKKAVTRHIHTMIMHCHGTVLDMPSRLSEILRI